MKVLSIDTSTMISGCALMEDGRIIGEININQEKTHSEGLVPMIRFMLEGVGVSPSEIDLYAVASGPGSFTGLRIGMTTAKTMAQIFKKPIVGISTLKAVAYALPVDGLIVPILDARGGRVYYAGYRWKDKELECVYKEELTQFEDLLEQLTGLQTRVHLVGSAMDLFTEQMEKATDLIRSLPSASFGITDSICELALKSYQLGIVDDPFHLVPNYVRKSQAQRERDKRLGDGNTI